jgi:membrane associated rhomboid family serine protease
MHRVKRPEILANRAGVRGLFERRLVFAVARLLLMDSIMLSDRFYMRDSQERSSFRLIPWFLGVLVGVFVVQNLIERWFPAIGSIYDYAALSGSALRHGYVWTLLTYTLLHANFTHLLLNGLGLFFMGRQLEETIGPRRLVILTVVSALVSAAFWLGINFHRDGQVIGASGIAMAYLMVFACLQPRRPITFLVLFIIPVTMKPLWMVAIAGGIDLAGFFWTELPGGPSGWIAHSAHLGGLAGGWLFYQLIMVRGAKVSTPAIEPPAWFKKPAARAPGYVVNLPGVAHPAAPAPKVAGRDQVRAEVDRILDKINEHGFGALTPAEKRMLDEAREVLRPR